jgi:hypothetical protein
VADANLYAQAVAQLPGAIAQVNTASGESKLYATSALVRLIGTAAANAPTMTLRASWLAQYKALAAQEAALPKPDYGAPAAWLKALDSFSDFAIQTGKDILSGVAGTVKTLPAIAKALPWLTLALIVVAGVVLVKWGPSLLPVKRGK